MRLIEDRSNEVCDWAAAQIERMGGRPFSRNAVGFGFEMNGELVAAAVLSDWQPQSRTMAGTFAATDPRWAIAGRAGLDRVFRYVFDECDVVKLWAVTPSRNLRALRLARHLGFKPEAVLARQFGDDDAVFSAFFVEDFRARRACLR